MATLNGGASGVVGHSGSARGRYILKAIAAGVVGHSGSALGFVVAGVHVTQAGAQVDVTGVIDALATQAGAFVDVTGVVPEQVTQTGANIDVDRITPAQATTAGIGLDVDRIIPAHLSTIGAQIDARYQRIRTLTMCWEFHVFTRGGTYLTYLDNAFDKSYLAQLWDVGGGSFRLPSDDAKATTTNLQVGNIVKVRYANVDIGAWIMETIATTYVDTGEGAARIITVSGRGLLSSLQKGLVYPTDIGDPATVERAFTTATKADIFLTLYAEYVARGGGLFTTSFTATNDTNSAAWSDSVSLKFKAGQTILDVLRQLQGFGLEVIAQPDKTLDAFISAGSDISASIAFRYGQNVLSCSTTLQGGDLANAVLGEADGVLDEDTDAGSITTYGRQEAYLPVRNTAEADDIAAANTAFLASYATPPNSIALQVATFPNYPLVDYDLGDTVHVSIPDDIDADYRILAIAMQEGTGPCDLRVTLELNSLQAEYLARLQRAMDASLASIQPGQAAASGLASSSTSSEGGTGATTLDELTDVVITGPADNEVLAYNTASSRWINQTAAEAGLTAATLTTKGDLLTWDTALARLPVGADGQVLTADSGSALGVKWAAAASAGSVATDAIWDAKGDLAVGTAADLATRLAVGTVDGQVLTVDAAEPTGLKWAAASAGSVATDAIWDAAGDLVYGTASDAATRLAIGTVGQVLTVSSGTLPAWEDATPGSGAVATDTIWDAKGDLAVGTASNLAARLAVGTVDGYVLTVDASTATGLKWAAVTGGTASMATDTLWAASGDLAYATGNDAGTVLAIGTVGHVLTVGAGTVPAWAAATSGGDTTGIAWPSDVPPGSPNAKDDEFDDESINVKWTAFNHSTYITPAEESYGALHITHATGDNFVLRGYTQTAPEGDFTITARVNGSCLGSYIGAGIMVLAGTGDNDDKLSFAIQGLYGGNRLRRDTWDTNTSRSGFAEYAGYDTTFYLRFRRVTSGGSTWYCDASADGILWRNVYSVGEPFTITHIGVCSISNQATYVAEAVYYWFRVDFVP